MTPECVAFRDVAPELALGIAEGDERAAALAHLVGCDACRQALARLTEAVDAVVQTAPGAEPPSGFEVRALSSFEAAAPAAGPSPWRRVALVAAAVVAVAAVGFGIRAMAAHDGGAGTEQAAVDRSTAALTTPGGAEVGSVRVDRQPGGGPTDLVVSVDAGAPAGAYRVECDYESGRSYRAGELEVGPGGVADWRTTVSVPTYDLTRVRLVSAGEADNLEAEFG